MTEHQAAALAGAYYVAHRLAMLGFVPLPAGGMLPGADLIAVSADGRRFAAVQVRSSSEAMHEDHGAPQGSYSLEFAVGRRASAAPTEGVLCLVDLHAATPGGMPDVYVIPAQAVQAGLPAGSWRKYGRVEYRRPWRDLQPFRNNWAPLYAALGLQAPPRQPESLRPKPNL